MQITTINGQPTLLIDRPLTTADTEAVAAILHVRSNGEPDTDPDTGENAWTSAYNAIETAINAHTTTALADNTPDDQLTAGRNKTRGLLGLPPLPSAATTIASPDDHRAAGRRRINGTRQPPRRPRRRHRHRNRPIHRITHPHRQRKGPRLMDDKNLYPAMIGKLREMIADSTIQIAALQAQIDILAKENQRLTDQLNKDDDNGNA